MGISESQGGEGWRDMRGHALPHLHLPRLAIQTRGHLPQRAARLTRAKPLPWPAVHGRRLSPVSEQYSHGSQDGRVGPVVGCSVPSGVVGHRRQGAPSLLCCFWGYVFFSWPGSSSSLILNSSSLEGEAVEQGACGCEGSHRAGRGVAAERRGRQCGAGGRAAAQRPGAQGPGSRQGRAVRTGPASLGGGFRLCRPAQAAGRGSGPWSALVANSSSSSG